MDKVADYLTDRPDGATAEEIAREALGLRGAVGPVATQVIRAAAETNERIRQRDDGRWHLHAGETAHRLRTTVYASIATREREDGTLEVAVTRVGFAATEETETYELPRGRSDAGNAAADRLSGAVAPGVPIAFRLASVRGGLNKVSRLQIGRSCIPEGLCLSKLARRSFPALKIRTAADIAGALGLPFVEPEDVTASSRQQAELLLGLLERCEQRGIETVEDVLEDLQPLATSVDFEAFAFDEGYLDELPTGPGVYVMRDTDGKVIYVGKSINLRDRVRTYFAKRSEREEKTLKILDRIWTVEVQEVGSELEALILEARLIQATRPEFNKQVETHDRDASDRPPYVIVLPSADTDSVELFCVRADTAIRHIRVRKDLTDWAEGWSDLTGYFDADAAAPGDAEVSEHRILKSWVQRKEDSINLIDVGDAGHREDLKRVLTEHIRASDSVSWEKVWRV